MVFKWKKAAADSVAARKNSRRRGHQASTAASGSSPEPPYPDHLKLDYKVLIDDRAGSRELIYDYPIRHIGQLCRLDSGDAMLNGYGPNGRLLVGVEIKSITDLISSADTGRLQGTQIPTMFNYYDIVWLVHYGLYRPGPNGELQIYRGKGWRNHALGKRSVPFGYIEALLLTLAASGVRVKRCTDRKEVAQWLGVLARWWNKPWDKHRGLHALDQSKDRSLMPDASDAEIKRARVAAQLPGIGFERAIAAAKYFPSIKAMMDAGVKDWMEVEGIGKTIAQSVVRAIKE